MHRASRGICNAAFLRTAKMQTTRSKAHIAVPAYEGSSAEAKKGASSTRESRHSVQSVQPSQPLSTL
eukprot:1140853-Pelagomonas_calceolata.AAC.13